MKRYVLDACAVIAFLVDEAGADKVEEKLQQAAKNEIEVHLHTINLLEIFYGFYREKGEVVAQNMMRTVSALPIQIEPNISSELLSNAGVIKATNNLSLADSIALGFSKTIEASLVTADHHEFDQIRLHNPPEIFWIR